MAAGQQKKRLTNTNLHEQYRLKKKKKLSSSDYVVNLRSHVNLEWNDRVKSAVANKEQVGITWKDMAPFVDLVPQFQSGIADVFSVPREIFGLEDLNGVLSYEVWATCLSESERKLLAQFLPSEAGAEQAVHSLLNGENHHFGNPFLDWSTSLCSGRLHPDTIVRMERRTRANKRAYYRKLKKYHNDMIEVLKRLKESWMSGTDPEKLWRKGLTKHKETSLPLSAEKAQVGPIKKEMAPKACARNVDAAKYMSCIKVNKQQYELVKNLKHSGDGIQAKSLHRVLGDIKDLHVQPYEAFEEEESKRLHQHWLTLARKDLPAAFEVWRDRKLQREIWGKSLEQEFAEVKISTPKSEENDKMEGHEELAIDGEPELQHSIGGVDQEDGSSTTSSMQDHLSEHIPFPSTSQQVGATSLDQEALNRDIRTPGDIPDLKHFAGKAHHSDSVMEPTHVVSLANGMWQDVNNRDSYYQPTLRSHNYISADNKLSLMQPKPVLQHPVGFIDLKRKILEPENGERIASALRANMASAMFRSYANQDHNELLQKFPSRPPMLSRYPQETMNDLKDSGLRFLSDPGQFPHQFQEQQQLIDQRHGRGKEVYLNQMMSKNIYANGSYPIEERLSSVDPHGLAAFPTSLNGGLAGHSWFPDENRARDNWLGVEPSNNAAPCLGGSGSADGGLFSVLSECQMLPSQPSYNENKNLEQFVEARNYGGVGIANNENIYSYAPRQLQTPSSLNAGTAPSALRMNNMPWMSFPHQNQRSWNQ